MTVGLVCALAVPLLFNLVVDPYVVADATRRTQGAIVGLAVYWTLAGALVGLTAVVERRPLSTIGLRRLSLGEFGVAAGIGSALWFVFLVPVVLQAVGGPSGAADMGSELAAWVVAAGVVTAAVTEEVVFRGYALERLTERTGRQWIGALVSLAVFVAIHVPYWPLAHVVGVVVPAGVALTGLYLWKRNLPFVIVVHFVFNAPLVALALPG